MVPFGLRDQAIRHDMAFNTSECVPVQYPPRTQGLDAMVHKDAIVLVRVLGRLPLPVAPKDVHAHLDFLGVALLDQTVQQCFEKARQWIHRSWNRVHLTRLVNHQRRWTFVHPLGKL